MVLTRSRTRDSPISPTLKCTNNSSNSTSNSSIWIYLPTLTQCLCNNQLSNLSTLKPSSTILWVATKVIPSSRNYSYLSSNSSSNICLWVIRQLDFSNNSNRDRILLGQWETSQLVPWAKVALTETRVPSLPQRSTTPAQPFQLTVETPTLVPLLLWVGSKCSFPLATPTLTA